MGDSSVPGYDQFYAQFCLSTLHPQCSRARHHGREFTKLADFKLWDRTYSPGFIATVFRTVLLSYHFRQEAILACYGLAENVAGVASTRPEHHQQCDWIAWHEFQTLQQAVPATADRADAKCIVSCGYPIQGTELAILDAEGNWLPERQIGEVAIRGTSLFSGYYRQPELTAQAFRDGWFCTGDIGYLAEGQLYICDRKKDLIIVAGQNIFPNDLEAIALSVLAKRAGRVAAFGVYDERLGTETPVLVCEVKGHAEESACQAYTRQIRQRAYQELGVGVGDVRFVRRDWLVKTTSGKVARQASKQKYLASGFRLSEHAAGMTDDCRQPGSTPADIADQLRLMFQTYLGIDTIAEHENFFELGIDSIRYIRLLHAIEQRFHVTLPMDALALNPTIAQLVAILSRASVSGEEDAQRCRVSHQD